MNNYLSDIQKQRILELYLCGNDKRLAFIGSIIGCCSSAVSKVIQDYFDKKIPFYRGDFQILHSDINYINNTDLNKNINN